MHLFSADNGPPIPFALRLPQPEEIPVSRPRHGQRLSTAPVASGAAAAVSATYIDSSPTGWAQIEPDFAPDNTGVLTIQGSNTLTIPPVAPLAPQDATNQASLYFDIPSGCPDASIGAILVHDSLSGWWIQAQTTPILGPIDVNDTSLITGFSTVDGSDTTYSIQQFVDYLAQNIDVTSEGSTVFSSGPPVYQPANWDKSQSGLGPSYEAVPWSQNWPPAWAFPDAQNGFNFALDMYTVACLTVSTVTVAPLSSTTGGNTCAIGHPPPCLAGEGININGCCVPDPPEPAALRLRPADIFAEASNRLRPMPTPLSLPIPTDTIAVTACGCATDQATEVEEIEVDAEVTA